MINLFVKTNAQYAEEDRLTNALMGVLQHADPMVLNSFLHILGSNLSVVDSCDEVSFDLQVSFKHSRPDARLRARDWEIIIEVKRFESLDESQFSHHWAGIQDNTRRTVLLSLTSATASPSIVQRLNAQPRPLHLTATHISWGDILRMTCELSAEFEEHTKTGFLLRQFERYLRHLGYYYIEGHILEDLKQYGQQLISLAKHEASTKAQLHAHLTRLQELIDDNLTTLKLSWSITSWSEKKRANDQRAYLDYLNADVAGLSKARYRVLPSVSHQGELSLHYYFTFSKSSKQDERWQRVIQRLLQRREEIESACGPLHRIGLLPDNIRVFHINRRVNPELIQRFFESNDEGARELASEIATFFESLDGWIREAMASEAGL